MSIWTRSDIGVGCMTNWEVERVEDRGYYISPSIAVAGHVFYIEISENLLGMNVAKI